MHQSVRKFRGLSVRKRASALNVLKSSIHRILCKDLRLPYKLELIQELKPIDAAERLNFANEVIQRFRYFNNILLSDDAHLHLNGLVNKQNCRYLSSRKRLSDIRQSDIILPKELLGININIKKNKVQFRMEYRQFWFPKNIPVPYPGL
ncbi:hypothetical protein Trydic_g3052 [Trypoxylus dichotomus]